MKRYLFALFHASGVTRFASWCHRKRVIFLCYHGVTKRSSRSSTDPQGLHVNHKRFAAHLEFLKQRYHIISIRDFIAAREGGKKLPHYSVVLTFDDGFRNFLTVAAPLLTEQQVPATVFLITDKAAEETGSIRNRAWTPEDDRRHLSWAEARFLKDELKFEIGSHTCTHSGLLSLSPDETERELRHSYEGLVSHLNVEAPTLSYPKGQYSQLLANDARKVGYTCAVTTDRGPNELDHDPFTLGRTLIGDNDDIASFAVRVSGLRWWLASMRDVFMKRSWGTPGSLPVSVAPTPDTLVSKTDLAA